MGPDDKVVIEVFGEGKTDVGHDPQLRRPQKGVVPTLLHKLCGKPQRMRVKCYTRMYLEKVDVTAGGGYRQKATAFGKLAWRNGSHATVFVVDSDGDLRKRNNDLAAGRSDAKVPIPMALGVAHPCIESWLLTDATAIRRALDLSATPQVPGEPENLLASRQNRRHNPKTELIKAAGANRDDLSAKEKDAIAKAINDVDLLRTRCPLGFAPFAEEVDRHIRPLF